MKIVTRYPDGVFSWIDLSTPDVEGAKMFYGSLFGWEFDDQPTDQGTLYTMCLIDGNTVAGMGPQQPEITEQGVPPLWTSYVKHDDAESIAAKISEAGGNLMMPPMDVMQEGRMLIATDPAGAAFGVWQPRNHIGAAIVNQPNSLVWNELQTRDLSAATSFYNQVFGWTAQEDENGYVLFATDGRGQAGGMLIEESWGPVPPNWTIYFLVEDVNAYAHKAKGLGGTVMVPPTAAGKMGRFSVLQDPHGGTFSIIQYNGPASPPPGH